MLKDPQFWAGATVTPELPVLNEFLEGAAEFHDVMEGAAELPVFQDDVEGAAELPVFQDDVEGAAVFQDDVEGAAVFHDEEPELLELPVFHPELLELLEPLPLFQLVEPWLLPVLSPPRTDLRFFPPTLLLFRFNVGIYFIAYFFLTRGVTR